MFQGKTGLNSVTLGKGIREIGSSAFEGATDLVTIVVPESLTTIGDRAFAGCTAFGSVILYDAVETIGTDAFKDCPKLTIYCNQDSAAFSYAKDNNIKTIIMNPDAAPEFVTENGVIYYISNGTAVATGHDASQMSAEVTIPATIKGCPVTELRGTFNGNSSITSVSLLCNVTLIGEKTFYNCSALKSVNIPDGVTTIGKEAFYNCSKLESVSIPGTVTAIEESAFSGCGSLTQIDIPASVKSLGSYAFNNCYNLTRVTVPGIKVIGYQAFGSCSNLETVTLSKGTERIDGYAFAWCYKLTSATIPDSVREIGHDAFCQCTSLASVKIPEGVKTIENEAFAYCTSLRKLAIPASVQTIYSNSLPDNTVWLVREDSAAQSFAEENDRLYVVWDGVTAPFYDESGITYLIMNGSAAAIFSDAKILPTDVTIPGTVNGFPVTELRGTFSGNSKITSVSLPSSVTLIGEKTFYNCYALDRVSISAGVTTIGKEAFSNCSALKSVNIPNTVTKIEQYAFASCYSLPQIDIPTSVHTLGQYAFSGCGALTQVTVPGIEVISYEAFGYCNNLETVILSQGTTQIDSFAFTHCPKLKSITISDSVREISDYAFGYCTSLESVVIPENVETIDNLAFDGCTSLQKLAIPAGVQTIYRKSLPDNTVWLVREGSQALSVAKDNDRLYIIWDGINEPEFYVENGITYLIANNSAIAFFSDAYKVQADVAIPKTVKGCPVTELRGTFRNNGNITSVTLPGSVTRIGESTFYNCYALERVNIPAGVTIIGANAFSNCSALKSVNIPDTVEKIEIWAFAYCYSLPQIDIPASVNTLDQHAFYNCDALTQVTIPGIEIFGHEAFGSCDNLETVILSEGSTQIGSWAFANCPNLKSVTIPDSVTYIWDSAFCSCTSLENIVIPNSVTTVGSYAFADCTSLQKLVIPASVRMIYPESLADNIVWIVTEGSYAHNVAKNNDRLYFVLPDWDNPDIAYGTEITGTVTYTNGSPAVDADVEIFYSDGTSKEKVKTDENGGYKLTYAEVGRYTIRASDAQGNSQNETVSVKRINAFDVFVSGDTDLVLKQGYTVSGTITPSDTATVTLSDTDGKVIATAANVSGSYRISNIPNGSYILKAENQTGSVLREIRVFNADVTEDLDIPAASAAITGTAAVADRDGSQSPTAWVLVSAYNSEGVLTAQTRSDAQGRFSFTNIPLSDYALVAEYEQMRPATGKEYERNYTLTGYAYISVTENKEYDVGTIVLYEESDSSATISGKVTANGQPENCTVFLTNVFRFGVAKNITGGNGKYIFKNIPDGLYFVTAVTSKLGMGFTVVVVRNGVVYGETNIQVLKSNKVLSLEKESSIMNIREDEAASHIKTISEEKARYDGLSDKERQQLDQDYLKQLNSLAEKAANYSATASTGFAIANGGTLISAEEIAQKATVNLELRVIEKQEHIIPDDGIKSEEDHVQQMIVDAAGRADIAGYYDITLLKNGREITDIAKQTDTAGKLRVTMNIPQAYLGKQHYGMVHVHNGEVTTLIDLDENPNTATFEMDKFSLCALTYSDKPLTEKSLLTVNPDNVTLTLGETSNVTVKWEEGDVQSIDVISKNTAVVTASVQGTTITLTPVAEGETTVTVNVTGPDGTSESDTITVKVNGSDSGSKTDKSALTAAIAEAEKAGDIKTVADGTPVSDVEEGVKFVIRSVKDALTKAITDAKNVRDDASADEDAVAKAVADLKAAVESFNKAIQIGTKTTGSGSGNGNSSSSGGSSGSSGNGNNSSSSGGSGSSNSEGSSKPGTIPADKPEPNGETDSISKRFTDLGGAEMWYYDAVDYVLRNGLMNGYSSSLFGPNDNLSRAQLAQILYNKEGKPAVTGGSAFTDVPNGQWFAPAIAWASANGIVGGYGNGRFGPNDNITREQLAVMLWRYAGRPAATDKELRFSDADQASGYAMEALLWAVENGVMNGKSGGILDPRGLATRAQTAQMLKNFLEQQ